VEVPPRKGSANPVPRGKSIDQRMPLKPFHRLLSSRFKACRGPSGDRWRNGIPMAHALQGVNIKNNLAGVPARIL